MPACDRSFTDLTQLKLTISRPWRLNVRDGCGPRLVGCGFGLAFEAERSSPCDKLRMRRWGEASGQHKVTRSEAAPYPLIMSLSKGEDRSLSTLTRAGFGVREPGCHSLPKTSR